MSLCAYLNVTFLVLESAVCEVRLALCASRVCVAVRVNVRCVAIASLKQSFCSFIFLQHVCVSQKVRQKVNFVPVTETEYFASNFVQFCACKF